MRRICLDLAIVNPSGYECSYSLQLVVCLLLHEITRFLRETYEYLPKLSSAQVPNTNSRQQRNNLDPVDQLRMGSVVSQLSNKSTNSLTNEQPPGMKYIEVRVFFCSLKVPS